MKTKYTSKDVFLDSIHVLLGAILYSIAIVCFLAPCGIAAGGVSGLSTIINYKLPFLPIGILTIVFNIPIMIVGYISLGGKFVLKTAISTVFTSLVTFIFERLPFIPTYTNSTLLACIFGGALLGSGIGLIFLRGYTTGGTDVVVKVLRKKNPQFSTGTLTLGIDFLVISLAGIAYANIENSFYALISIFVSTTVLDKILNGADSAKLAYIVSDKSEEIAAYITREINRGVTVLHGRGYYSGKERDVLMVVLRPQQLFGVRNILKQIDPNAFMIFTNASEVLGQGFKRDLNP